MRTVTAAAVSLFFLVVLTPKFCLGSPVTIHATRSVDTLGSAGPSGPDTLQVTLRFSGEGAYDTLWHTDTLFDTSRIPLDIILAIDLSSSMNQTDGTSRWRIAWAKIAALGFLDSLKTGDRIAVFGWTSAGNGAVLSDTVNTGRFYQRWSPFTGDIATARAFIRDSVFLDGAKVSDTTKGLPIVLRDAVPGGTFGDTPLHCASILAASRLSTLGRRDASRSVIMLTDGENDDFVPLGAAVSLIDSLKRTKGTKFFSVGFMQGDTTELRSLATAGAGTYYNATNPRQLDSVYARLAGQLIETKIDTTYSLLPITVSPDTVRSPLDVLLAIDLSPSMSTTDGTSRWRIAWAKIAALGFLDSLQVGDRVSVLGWTGNESVRLSDTAMPGRYYQRWSNFTSDFAATAAFVRDSLYCRGSLLTDVWHGDTLVVQNAMPGGTYGYTPLRVTTMLAMSRLSSFGRPQATKAVIMLTDGMNNDGELRSTAATIVDSLRRTQGLLMHTIGFIDGDTVELHALANAGGGNFYNAKDNIGLQSAYATLAHQLVVDKPAARKLMIQEVLATPPIRFVSGSQKASSGNSVPVESFESFTDLRGNTVLRWYFKTVPVWRAAEVSYVAISSCGACSAIGVDSILAAGSFFSRMAYTDDAFTPQSIALPPTGGSPQAAIHPQRHDAPQRPVFLQNSGIARVLVMVPAGAAVSSGITLKLLSVNGRIVYRSTILPGRGGGTVWFPLPERLPCGVYAAQVELCNAVTRHWLRIVK